MPSRISDGSVWDTHWPIKNPSCPAVLTQTRYFTFNPRRDLKQSDSLLTLLKLSRPGFLSSFGTGGGSSSSCITSRLLKIWQWYLDCKTYDQRYFLWGDDVILRSNYVMIAKWRQSSIRRHGSLDFLKTSGKHQNWTKSNQTYWTNTLMS